MKAKAKSEEAEDEKSRTRRHREAQQKTASRLSTSSLKGPLNTSSTSLFNADSSSTSCSAGGFKTLQLFKDIKNLQMKIQNDLDY